MGHTLMSSLAGADPLRARPAGLPRLVRPDDGEVKVLQLLAAQLPARFPPIAPSSAVRNEDPERWDGLA